MTNYRDTLIGKYVGSCQDINEPLTARQVGALERVLFEVAGLKREAKEVESFGLTELKKRTFELGDSGKFACRVRTAIYKLGIRDYPSDITDEDIKRLYETFGKDLGKQELHNRTRELRIRCFGPKSYDMLKRYLDSRGITC
jgi:hypothetical protein